MGLTSAASRSKCCVRGFHNTKPLNKDLAEKPTNNGGCVNGYTRRETCVSDGETHRTIAQTRCGTLKRARTRERRRTRFLALLRQVTTRTTLISTNDLLLEHPCVPLWPLDAQITVLALVAEFAGAHNQRIWKCLCDLLHVDPVQRDQLHFHCLWEDWVCAAQPGPASQLSGPVGRTHSR